MSAKEMAALMPTRWPDFFARALEDMNSRILPSLGYSPRELLLGMTTSEEPSLSPPTRPASPLAAHAHLAFADTLRADGHARTMTHAAARKKRTDAHIDEERYEPDDFVQVYNDRLDGTLSTERKLAAKWSAPMRVVTRYLNSWRVRPLDAADGTHELYVSGRRLRRWVPARGTAVHTAVLEKERRLAEERLPETSTAE